MAQEDNHGVIQTLIEDKAKDNWIDTEISYQDVPYVVKKGVPFIELNVLFGESENSGLNSLNQPEVPVRENGILLIACFTKSNDGTKEVLRIAGKIRSLYQNTDENGLAFYAGSIYRGGEEADFLRYNVEIPFYYQ